MEWEIRGTFRFRAPQILGSGTIGRRRLSAADWAPPIGCQRLGVGRLGTGRLSTGRLGAAPQNGRLGADLKSYWLKTNRTQPSLT